MRLFKLMILLALGFGAVALVFDGPAPSRPDRTAQADAPVPAAQRPAAQPAPRPHPAAQRAAHSEPVPHAFSPVPVAAAPIVTAVTTVRATPANDPGLLVSIPAALDRDIPAPSPTTADTPAIHEVVASLANVRAGPGTGAEVIERLPRGELVGVIEQKDGWSRIRIEGDGIEGWVATRLLTPVAD